MIAEPVRRAGRPRPEVVRRLVSYRLPLGSLVLDVAGDVESVLDVFTDSYHTLAVRPRGGTGSEPPTPTVWADLTRLPLAAASVDCVLLLDSAGVHDDRRLALIEAGRVLRPGGLMVMAAAGGSGRAVADLTTTMRELGLVPEQVHHLQVLRHPLSIVRRARIRARLGRSSPTRGQPDMPWLCRAAAALERAERAGPWRPRPVRAAGLLAFARKP